MQTATITGDGPVRRRLEILFLHARFTLQVYVVIPSGGLLGLR